MSETMTLRVRIEQTIPKLLVKINPVEAQGFSAKNLGEVTLRKQAAARQHVAVLHMSHAVGNGELLMSLKLAELLGLEEDERVEISLAAGAGGAPTEAASLPRSSAAPLFPQAGGAPGPGAEAARRATAPPERPQAAPREQPAAARPERQQPRCEAGPLPGTRTATRRSLRPAVSHEEWVRGLEAQQASMRNSGGGRASKESSDLHAGATPPPLRVAPGMDATAQELGHGRYPTSSGIPGCYKDHLGSPTQGKLWRPDFGADLAGEKDPEDQPPPRRRHSADVLHEPADVGGDGRRRHSASAKEAHDGFERKVPHAGSAWAPAASPWATAAPERGPAAAQGFGAGPAPAAEVPRLAQQTERVAPAARGGLFSATRQSASAAAATLLHSYGSARGPPAPPGAGRGAAGDPAAPASPAAGGGAPCGAPAGGREGYGLGADTGTPLSADELTAGAAGFRPPRRRPSRTEDGPGLRAADARGDVFEGRPLTPPSAGRAAAAAPEGGGPAGRTESPAAAGAPAGAAAFLAPQADGSPEAASKDRFFTASPPQKPKEGGLPPRRSNFEMRSIVPFQGGAPNGKDKTPTSGGSTSSFKRAASVRRRSTLALGALQPSATAVPSSAEERVPVPSSWRPPEDTGGGYERSELGNEITAEVRRWLIGDTSGPQCSQVVLDRALTVLSNFKLASGCQLEVLGGPLGAIIGGYSDADWLHAEVFQKQPADAIREAFALLGFKARVEGDWSNFVAEEVSLAYRRLCLRGHPSRGGSPRSYLKLQVAMELVRAFAGEAGPLARGSNEADGYTLNDQALSRELKLTMQEAEEEATKLPKEQLEEMNRALDEYILRQMCFKSEIVDEIARLHENSAYALLGVSSDATDAEIKRAYRLVARECHPDKGGDKEEFQELNAAFERIMEQRKSVSGGKWSRNAGGGDADGSDQEQAHGQDGDQPKAKGSKARPKGKSQDQSDQEQEGTEEAGNAKGEDKSDAEANSEAASDDEGAEEGSNAQLIEKASKAAEEASRYAKTAAEFAHQAADAAETARKGREQGSQDTLTKSIAHSAIVLTLTVVKAVRVVGYATLDVAAQCRAAAQRNPDCAACAERSVEAMSLGLEALNAALACAEVTEITAAELQGTGVIAPGSPEGEKGTGSSAAERFVGAAVRASLSAASASNAAMTAAIAAVEGSRQVMEAVGESEEQAKGGKKGEDGGDTSATKADGAEDSDGAEDAGEDVTRENSDSPPRQPKQMSPEEAAAAARRRLVSQRHNNHKVLHRLNAEILSHQQNVRQFLQANRQLIPEISEESKQRVMRLLQDYSREARADLESALQLAAAGGPLGSEALLAALTDLQILVPVLQPTQLAISVSVKARVLKMAALYDLPRTVQVLEQEVFAPVRAALRQDSGALAKVVQISEKVQQELSHNVAEQDTAESSPH